jgi:hypothetical protein
MLILHSLLNELKDEFAPSGKGEERKAWFLHTLLAIILPFTPSRTSCLLRAFQTLFGFLDIGKTRHYTFMASQKIPDHHHFRPIDCRAKAIPLFPIANFRSGHYPNNMIEINFRILLSLFR